MTPFSAALRRQVRRLRSEEGLGLVELMVAFLVLNVAILGMAAAAGTTLRSLDSSKKRQTAVTLATAALEAARALPYRELVMSGFTDTTRYNPETNVDNVSCSAPERHRDHPSWCGELLVHRAGGAIAANTPPYRFTQDGLTVQTRVSWMCVVASVAPPDKKCTAASNAVNADMSAYSKRVTVTVTSAAAKVAVKQSTVVSEAVRGLAGAQFSFFPSAGDSVSAPNLNEICFPHTVKNSGSNDAYEVVFPTTSGYQYKAYLDKGTRGVRDALDEQLVDLTGNGHPNSQAVATGDTIYLLLCYTPTSLPADGTNVVMQTSVRSAFDTTVVRNATHTLLYTTTLRMYLAHMSDDLNQGNPTPAAGGVFDFNLELPDRPALIDYDTDNKLGKRADRKSDGDTSYAFSFERKFGRPLTLANPGSLVVWTASHEAINKPTSNSAKKLVTRYRLERVDDQGTVLAATAWKYDAYIHDYAPNNPSKPQWYQRTVALPSTPSNFAFGAGDRLRLTLHCSSTETDGIKPDDNCAFAYDTTSHPAYLQMGLQ